MTNLLDQRCLNHALREAAVQCPSCKRFFCRECVTEHAGRMICVGCVSVLARREEKTARAARLRWAMTALFGILIAWLVFYYLGLTLARIPSEFHSASKSLGRGDPLSQGAAWTVRSLKHPHSCENRDCPLCPKAPQSPAKALHFFAPRGQSGLPRLSPHSHSPFPCPCVKPSSFMLSTVPAFAPSTLSPGRIVPAEPRPQGAIFG